MPAVEQTWRDTKLLHKIFGAASFVMLVATIWMFAADHNREWKPIQRTANDIEMQMTAWRESQFTTEEATRERTKLQLQLEASKRHPIPPDLLDAFVAEVHSSERTANRSFDHIRALAAEVEVNAAPLSADAQAGNEATAKADERRRHAIASSSRTKILEELRGIIKDARFQEDLLLGRRKFRSADRDAAIAEQGILLRDSRPPAEVEAKQGHIDQITRELHELTVSYQDAKEHRTKLADLLKQMTKDEDAAAEALEKNQFDLVQLEKANQDRRSTYINWVGFMPLPGKRFLELPILDAFNSPRKIDNLWSNDNNINYNFRNVRRFDRCTTCHQAMQKTLPGSAVDPAYEVETLLDFQLVLSKPGEESGSAAGVSEKELATEQSAAGSNKSGGGAATAAEQLEQELGLRLAEEGLIDRNAATVRFIRPETPAAAARAPLHPDAAKQAGDALRKNMLMASGHASLGQLRPGILVGDIIVAVNGDPVMEPRKVASRLLDAARDSKQITITVRRGLPSPYSTHPRLDLFVGSLSPHTMSEFACTICHDGQGSATAFKFASHTPNSELQRQDWGSEHGWFENSHWIYPMAPERFAESTCLKCHHSVVELEPSERFPEPPAPTVVHGYHLVSKYGCFGCHEINGYDGKRRIGPDLRLEPNVYAAAIQLKSDPGFESLTPEAQSWTNQLIEHPELDGVRHQLLEVLEADSKAEQPRLSLISRTKLTPLFRDIESPGSLRKPGPSLRFAGTKLDSAFLYDWIREPKHFRPSTRMPQFFGLTKHLGNGPGLKDVLNFEPIEILGLVTYLQTRSQKFDYLEPPEGITEKPDAARGKTTFQTRGCLACHNHKAFSDAVPFRPADEIVQGPDLSRVGDKFVNENSRKWLYSWIKQPSRYHARTVMPDLFLDPIRSTAAENKETVTDPAADIVEFLLNESKEQWKPKQGTLTKPEDANAEQLDRFVTLNLSEAFAEHRAVAFATKGIPESMRGELKGAEVELLVPDASRDDPSFKLSAEQKLLYIGSRTVSKFGCYGCHDIAGFEDAKPVGTVLADWGRKDSARLAFEHITHYIEHGHGHSEATDEAASHGADQSATAEPAPTQTEHDVTSQADRDYYATLLKSGNRAGFLWQKLLEPRSYDFEKTENKKYSERLRMPQFPFTAHDREAVVTFVLGLVAEPPTDKYVYKPTERTQAILAGRQVLEKYNCGGCHILAPEKWNVMAEPDRFGEQAVGKSFPFLRAHFTPETLTDSSQKDRSGLIRASLRGMPAVDDNGIPIAYDDAGDPLESDGEYDPNKLEWSFDLWQPTAIAGNPFEVGVLPLNIPAGLIQRRFGSDGGFLARYLLPYVVALEKQVNPAAKGSEAWGWLPPPLMGEGNKVQTDWLHSFLLNPYPIRPATYLRMPRFNMSSAEATKLVNYFAAMDNAEFPYSFSSRRQPEHLQEAESSYEATLKGAQFEGKARSRLDDAMRLVVNNNYCVKCHLVGDFVPTGGDRAKAPNLAMVYQRLRPGYLRNWIANPKSYLPYTSMPINVPYDPDAPNLGGVAQELYHGTSIEQIDGLVDLLMNYDEYAKQRNSVGSLVKQFGGAPPAAAPAETKPAAGEE